MTDRKRERLPAVPEQKPGARPTPPVSRELVTVSGRDTLSHILDQEDPKAFVKGISRVDFYWLIKQIGEEDSLHLLRLATSEQWEHLIDMEVWERDRMKLDQTTSWLGKILEADPGSLVGWFYGEGELFCYYYLFRSIQVEVKGGEEALDLPDGFTTLDNIYYIRVTEKEHEEIIMNLLRRMAAQDYQKYQMVLLGLAGVIPGELEEELYRRRNMRLAEDGFLPFEEALSLYSYVKAENLASGCSPYLLEAPPEPETGPAVPLIPFSHVGQQSFFVDAASRIIDPFFLDRLRLEFAGLCNQMVSADQIRISNMDVLVETCGRAAGYLNLGLEELSHGEIKTAEDLLKLHPLILIFQVGFSLTLELRWETERWAKEAWFSRMGLDFSFWGEYWGGTLEGILQRRPLYSPKGEEGTRRHFENLREVHQSRVVLMQIFAVDRLLGMLHSRYPFDPHAVLWDPLSTFYALLFTFWARKRLNLVPSFEPISLTEVKTFFGLLRKGGEKAPFRTEDSRPLFINDFIQIVGGDLGEQERETLTGTLSHLWDEFSEEYAWVKMSDVDGRFSRFMLIRPDSAGAPH